MHPNWPKHLLNLDQRFGPKIGPIYLQKFAPILSTTRSSRFWVMLAKCMLSLFIYQGYENGRSYPITLVTRVIQWWWVKSFTPYFWIRYFTNGPYFNRALFSVIRSRLLTDMHNVCLSAAKSKNTSNLRAIFTYYQEDISLNSKTPNPTHICAQNAQKLTLFTAQ